MQPYKNITNRSGNVWPRNSNVDRGPLHTAHLASVSQKYWYWNNSVQRRQAMCVFSLWTITPAPVRIIVTWQRRYHHSSRAAWRSLNLLSPPLPWTRSALFRHHRHCSVCAELQERWGPLSSFLNLHVSLTLLLRVYTYIQRCFNGTLLSECMSLMTHWSDKNSTQST